MSEQRGWRRRRGLIAAGVLVVLVAWFAVLALKTWSAYRHDQRGLAALQQVKAKLTPSELTSAGSVHLLDAARAEFASAEADLSSPLFAPITIVPVVGRQFRAVRALSTAAGTVCDVGSSYLAQVHSVLDQNHSAGPARVASLQKLASLSVSTVSTLAHIDTGPSQALVSPLAAKRNEFVTQLNDTRQRLTKAAGVAGVVATILQGPQTYLLMAANNAEMRSGSGAFLEVGSANTANGNVQLGDLTQSADITLPVGEVNPTGELQRNWSWLLPGVDFRNLGMTPQFDVTAPLAARMWTARTGQPVNGVISLDIVAVRQLLEATGPVESDGHLISADNAEQFLLHDQYEGLTDSTASAHRVDALGALAKDVLNKLEGQTTDLKALATSVSSAVAGRHLMMWSSNPVAQAVWVSSGVSGSLTSQSVGVSLYNRGGNKLDQFVPIHVAVTTSPAGPDTTVTMTTKVINATPAGEPQFIGGPDPGVPVSYGGYFGLVTANLPAAARQITMTGAGPLAVKGVEGPTSVVSAPLSIPDGNTLTVVIRFRMPGAHGSMTVMPSTRIPTEQWTSNGKVFDDSTPTTVTW